MLVLTSSRCCAELLGQLGVVDYWQPPPCRLLAQGVAARLVLTEVHQRALQASELYPQAVVLAVAQIVTCRRHLLVPDMTSEQAYLNLLSGRRHRVYSAVALRQSNTRPPASRLVRTDVASDSPPMSVKSI